MKKFILLSLVLILGFAGCKPKTVEQLVKENNVWMSNHYDNYMRFETYVVYNDYLDEETDGSYETITSVFQAVIGEGTSFDTKVIFFVNDQQPNIKNDFWMEDHVLKDEEIKLTFVDAFNRVMESNYSKPHSRNCVLRKEVGPVDANPQYIFGNTHAQLYVDAITGDVTNENPAYKGFGFKMPLGEWP